MRVNGTVEYLGSADGYGFIDTEVSPKDVLFHVNDMAGLDFDGNADLDGDVSLDVGQAVEFELVECNDGPRAIRITRIQSNR